MPVQVKCPAPKNMYLKVSMMCTKGFNNINSWYFSGTVDTGNITAEAYIKSCTIKVSRKVRSLYLAVSDVKRIPVPKPKPAINISSKGNNAIVQLGCTSAPLNHKKASMHKNIPNCIPNLISPPITLDKGTINLGK